MKLLVIIPALNEAENIRGVIKKIPRDISGVSNVDVVVVDDGSTDGTNLVAKKAGAYVLRNKKNKGLGAAFNKALQYAIESGYDAMVNIDGDGQFNPQDIPKLVKPILEGDADFVTASRFADEEIYPNMPRVKFWGNRLMSFLISSLTGEKFYDVSCGFRAYSKEAMLSLNLQGTFTYTQESFLNLVFRNINIVEVPVAVTYFEERKSRIASSIFSYGVKTFKIIFRAYRDYCPLRFFTGLASVFFVISLFFGSILLHTYLTRGSFSPNIWSGFVGGVFFFVAVAFFVVGILADMNTRIRRNQESILYFLKKLHSGSVSE